MAQNVHSLSLPAIVVTGETGIGRGVTLRVPVHRQVASRPKWGKKVGGATCYVCHKLLINNFTIFLVGQLRLLPLLVEGYSLPREKPPEGIYISDVSNVLLVYNIPMRTLVSVVSGCTVFLVRKFGSLLFTRIHTDQDKDNVPTTLSHQMWISSIVCVLFFYVMYTYWIQIISVAKGHGYSLHRTISKVRMNINTVKFFGEDDTKEVLLKLVLP